MFISTLIRVWRRTLIFKDLRRVTLKRSLMRFHQKRTQVREQLEQEDEESVQKFLRKTLELIDKQIQDLENLYAQYF